MSASRRDDDYHIRPGRGGTRIRHARPATVTLARARRLVTPEITAGTLAALATCGETMSKRDAAALKETPTASHRPGDTESELVIRVSGSFEAIGTPAKAQQRRSNSRWCRISAQTHRGVYRCTGRSRRAGRLAG